MKVWKIDRGLQGPDRGECWGAEHQRDGSPKSTRIAVSREAFGCVRVE
jgi:hypothetical protein